MAALRAGQVLEWVRRTQDHASVYEEFCGVRFDPAQGFLTWGALDDPDTPALRVLDEAALRRMIVRERWCFAAVDDEALATAMREAFEARDWERLQRLAYDLSLVRYPDTARGLWARWAAATASGPLRANDVTSWLATPYAIEGITGVNVCAMARALYEAPVDAAACAESMLTALPSRLGDEHEIDRWKRAVHAWRTKTRAADLRAECALLEQLFCTPAGRSLRDRALADAVRAYARGRLADALERRAHTEVVAWAQRFGRERSDDRVLALWGAVAKRETGGSARTLLAHFAAAGCKDKEGPAAVHLGARLYADRAQALRATVRVLQMLEVAAPKRADLRALREELERDAARRR